MDIFMRLREERERLALSQTAMAALGGVQKRAQINYESGERTPDAKYLEGIAKAGVDVLYVLTGQCAGGVQPALDAAERVLLDNYRRCKPEGQTHLIQSSALLSAGLASAAPPAQAKPRSKTPPRSTTAKDGSGSGVTQTFHGTVQGGVNQTFHGTVQGDVINGVPAAGKTARGRRTAP